jgi:hypothetical protein
MGLVDACLARPQGIIRGHFASDVLVDDDGTPTPIPRKPPWPHVEQIGELGDVHHYGFVNAGVYLAALEGAVHVGGLIERVVADEESRPRDIPHEEIPISP